MLVPVGAALEAATASPRLERRTTNRSRTALEQRLERFERRGQRPHAAGARGAPHAHALERQTRTARRGFERQRTQVGKNLDLNVESLSTRVEPLRLG